MTVKNCHFFTGFEVRQTLWACRWASLADSINVSSQRGLDRAENWRSDGGRELTLFFKRHQTIQQLKCLQGERWAQAMIPTCLCEIQFIKPQSPFPRFHWDKANGMFSTAISQMPLSAVLRRVSSNCRASLLRTSQRRKKSISSLNSVACLLA